MSHERCSGVELAMDARPENLALARLALAGIAAGAGASHEVIADLKLAVTEACSNAIQHAYRDGGSTEAIVVRYELVGDALAVEVQDWGVGFEVAEALDELGNGGDDVSERGMGLRIIGAVTDELSVASSAGGTRVAFVRCLSPAG